MTKDEALDQLEEQVLITTKGSFINLDEAFVVAASALNYIMDKVEEDAHVGPESEDSDQSGA